ncbi:MAG: ATP-binding cassette domain-containing protein, partial [Candidatus Bathyarchaeia archaeon]
MTKVVEMKNIVKKFPGVLANDHINLEIEKGEIHALLGENGAGKTTLMNILYGLYKPDEGEIY